MAQVKLFVEDATMGKFLADIVLEHFNQKLILERSDRKTKGTGDVFSFGGWSQWHLVNDKFKEFTDKGYTNLLFVDADDNAQERINAIQEQNQQHKLSFQLFVFPDNKETSKGTVENLIEQIATNNDVLDCYRNFENCITGKNLLPPSNKTKLYVYTESLTTEQKRKENLHKDPERDYRNANWDLNHKSLKPLLDFLNPHFTK